MNNYRILINLLESMEAEDKAMKMEPMVKKGVKVSGTLDKMVITSDLPVEELAIIFQNFSLIPEKEYHGKTNSN
jgi:hypothetical protein